MVGQSVKRRWGARMFEHRLVFAVGVAAVLQIAAPGSSEAADVGGSRVPLFATDQFSAELFGGYLNGMSRELVYNVPGDRSKLSQLNWQIDSAAIVGGAVSYRALDWLNLRARGWVHAASNNALDDFDWLFGFNGFESWSDLSHYDDTRIAKAFQVDVSGSARLLSAGPVSLSALAGYRFETMKWNAYGGDFIYSTNGFRDDIGSFPAGEISIAYQQWWHTPYIGLGVAYASGPLALNLELIGSPFVIAHDRDNHVESLFKEAFRPTTMVGAAITAELELTRQFSLVARAEAERYFEAKGGITEYDFDPPDFSRSPKPAAGADHQSALMSLGVKARF